MVSVVIAAPEEERGLGAMLLSATLQNRAVFAAAHLVVNLHREAFGLSRPINDVAGCLIRIHHGGFARLHPRTLHFVSFGNTLHDGHHAIHHPVAHFARFTAHFDLHLGVHRRHVATFACMQRSDGHAAVAA